MSRNEMMAQAKIFVRIGAVRRDKDGHSIPTEKFSAASSTFRKLKKSGLNYLQIEKKLRKEF